MAYTSKFNEDEFNSIFAQRLRALMEENGCTQAKLANEVGITYQAIGAYRNGKSIPVLDVAQKIADFFNVSLDYLTGRTSIKSQKVDIQSLCASTLLSENAITSLIELSATKIDFLNHLLEAPSDLLENIAKKYILHIHVVNAVVPSFQMQREKIGEHRICIDAMINGESIPKVPIQDIEEYSEFELYRAFMKFVDYYKVQN